MPGMRSLGCALSVSSDVIYLTTRNQHRGDKARTNTERMKRGTNKRRHTLACKSVGGERRRRTTVDSVQS